MKDFQCPHCGALVDYRDMHACTNAPRSVSIPQIPVQSCTLCEPYGAGARCTGRCDSSAVPSGVPSAPLPLPQESQQEQDADTLARAAHFLRQHNLTQIAWEVDAVRARIAGVQSLDEVLSAYGEESRGEFNVTVFAKHLERNPQFREELNRYAQVQLSSVRATDAEIHGSSGIGGVQSCASGECQRVKEGLARCHETCALGGQNTEGTSDA